MGRPSDKRREELRKGEPTALTALHNNLLPIQRYYDIADKLFNMFEEAHQAGEIDQAYIFGKRVSTFCGDFLPTHPYYKSSRSDLRLLRSGNITNLNNVVATLEMIVEIMDEEEIRMEEEEKRKKLEMEKAAREKLLQRTRNLVNHTTEKQIISKEQLQIQASEKLRLLMRGPTADKSMKKDEDPKPKGSELASEQEPEPKPLPDLSVSKDTEVSPDNTPISTIETSLSNLSVLPAPIPVPPPERNKSVQPSPWDPVTANTKVASKSVAPTPPSYNFAVNQHPSQKYNNASFEDSATPSTNPLFDRNDGPQKSGSWLNETKGNKGRSSPEDSAIPIKQLRAAYKQEYEILKRQKKVEMFFLSTYQGRCRTPGHDSTNGCTVISPLIAINYLCSSSPGMADNTIEEVIDNKSPPILTAVRRKLGLPGDALIIPSDVHDYLVDLKLLRQDMFVGVCGGNILDPNHLTELLNMLKNGSTEEAEEKKNATKKVAAALFFHEHVISILKINLSNGDCWFDLVDSMPKSRTVGNMGGTRTRCKDIESLEVVLRMYACSKFTDTNCMYIDNNMWDDILCDFDPRVFQAFVWAS